MVIIGQSKHKQRYKLEVLKWLLIAKKHPFLCEEDNLRVPTFKIDKKVFHILLKTQIDSGNFEQLYCQNSNKCLNDTPIRYFYLTFVFILREFKKNIYCLNSTSSTQTRLSLDTHLIDDKEVEMTNFNEDITEQPDGMYHLVN